HGPERYHSLRGRRRDHKGAHRIRRGARQGSWRASYRRELRSDGAPPLYGVDAGFADMSEVLQSVKSQGEVALHDCKTHCEAKDVSIEIRLMQGVSDEFPREFACCARHADITVLGQPRHGDPLIG